MPDLGGQSDLMSMIHSAGFTGNAARIMYAIVMAESGGNARAHNTNASTGDNSYGLAQINMLGSLGPARLKEYGLSSNNDLFDPMTNLRVAYALSNGGRNFSPWTTYTRGTYRQYLGQTGAQVHFSGSGGGSGGMTPDGTSDGKLTKADYESTDSLGDLFAEVPELRKLIDEAVSGGWSTATFQNKVENSKWFRAHADTARAAIALKANDPATWNQKLSNEIDSVQHLANQLGMTLTHDVIHAIANNALFTGNDSNQQWLTEQISGHENYSKITNVDSLKGNMAATASQLSALAASYGFNWTPAQLAQKAQSIVVGTTTMDTYANNLKAWAKSAFPALAEQIDAGQTVSDLASPYVQSMSQLLEVDPSTIDTYTPMIRKALQGSVDPATKQRAATPLWQFEQQVRSDPRWQYTQNAKDTVASALVKIGADFGFGPDA